MIFKNLPCEVISTVENDDYFDDIENKHLPGDKIGVLVADVGYDKEIITYLMGITKNTNGDGTKLTNVDKVYEIIKRNNPINYNGIMNDINLMGYYSNNKNVMYVDKNDLCYKYIRYLYDDGG